MGSSFSNGVRCGRSGRKPAEAVAGRLVQIFAPLRQRPIALLWVGQVLSNIGDEIYAIALVWLAADIIGVGAGYLTALQAMSILLVGLLAGHLADAWDHRRTMIAVDVVRGIAVLLVPLAAYWHLPMLFVLVPVAIVVASMSAFFLPALKASLPELASDESLLTATNGLMETTSRLARIIGPALLGFLNAVVPIIHFFTIDAVSFFCSALSLQALHADLPPTNDPIDDSASGAWHTLRLTLDRLNDLPCLRFAVLASGIAFPAWSLVFPLAMALLLHQQRPQDVGALGWLVSVYGVGNLLSNLIVGSRPVTHPLRLFNAGNAVAGAGFIGLALSPNFPLMMLCSAVAASGGPMTSMGYVTLVQRGNDRVQIARTFRFAMTIEYSGKALAFLLSPWLFAHFGVAPMIVVCGAVMVGSAALGWTLDGK